MVSDDPDFASTVRNGLWNRMRTVTVRDGAQAAALIEQGVKPDVILLDSSASSVRGWIDFVRESLHCTPRCPPLLLIRAETVSSDMGWARLETTIESLTRRARREAALS